MLRLSPLALIRGGDDPDHLRGIGDVEAGQVLGVDSPVGERAVAQPVEQPVPLAVATRITGKWRIVAVWISVSASNSSSRVPKPPGPITNALRVAHEHHLAREEVAEAHADVDDSR